MYNDSLIVIEETLRIGSSSTVTVLVTEGLNLPVIFLFLALSDVVPIGISRNILSLAKNVFSNSPPTKS